LKNTKSNVVAHVCNHSYLGGRDWKAQFEASPGKK
jgi:hypothetical protein